jgi:mRNA interferase MazF
MKAGTAVTAEFVGVHSTKRRPALVISTEFYDQERPGVILAVITNQISKSKTKTDYVLQDWQSANLNKASAVRIFLFTLPQNKVTKIGDLSEKDWQNVQEKLRLSIESQL